MKEAFEKIIERLEEYEKIYLSGTIIPHCSEKTLEYCNETNCTDCMWKKAIEIVNQVAEEFAPDINAGSNDEYITLPKEAFNRMIARMDSESEMDYEEEPSWFINVKDAARIVFEIVREYQPEPEPQSKEPERPWREAIMKTFLSRG